MRTLMLTLLVACGGGDSPGKAGDPTSPDPEICDNGRDDDGDARADCSDDDCAAVCVEACDDGADNDGDGLADCADPDCEGQCPEICGNALDDDGDGVADCMDPDCDGQCPEACADGRDNDGDGAVDCDDDDCVGAACAEVCDDGTDNDGDGLADCADPDCAGTCPEDCANGRDDDGDGLVDCRDDDCRLTCDGDGDGFDAETLGGTDCDDTDAEVFPGATEVCNDGVDDDCDGAADDDDPSVVGAPGTWVDEDDDGWGGGEPEGRACVPPPGFSDRDGDCADDRADVNPDAAEVCGGGDEDCDGLVDDLDPDVDPSGFRIWYADGDGDGFGDPTLSREACSAPVGFVGNGDDCDDDDPLVSVDPTWRRDGDGDGVGAGAPSEPTCVAPGPDWVPAARGDDCADDDPARFPGAEEVCGDGIDQDCDGEDIRYFYADDDGDGYGAPDESVEVCGEPPPEGWVDNGDDCDDEDDLVHPGAPEVCNGLDDDCDGRLPPDELDGDGDGDPLCSDPDDADPDVTSARCWVFDGAEYVTYETNNPGYPLVTGEDFTTLIEDDVGSAAALIDFAEPLEPPYRLTFDFSIWDDDGSHFSDRTADGFAVQLFKDTSVYAVEPLPTGGTRGVINEGTGVVVHLQVYGSREVWIANGDGSRMATFPWRAIFTDGDWESVTIEVTDLGVRVTGDGMAVSWAGPFDMSFDTLAISAGTGGFDGEHRIRDVCMEPL